ncbi:MAG: aspartate kinase [Chloroflexi bacterium]|nr:aspartate kinase [Chloroflexota bacterium]
MSGEGTRDAGTRGRGDAETGDAGTGDVETAGIGPLSASPRPRVSASRPLLVQKFGGTSVANAERIRAAARRMVRTREQGYQVLAVVSAMGHTTDELIDLAQQVCERPDERELDLLLSTGETVSATLVAMALKGMGCPAISLTAAQAGIRTTRFFSRARITDIQPERIRKELAEDKVVIVTGFQGVTEDLDITTLGRGGSDTSAVALACALGAEQCEIYTDVVGVLTADPRLEPRARKLDRISYEEMLELAQLGAKVMHPRAVELGELYGMPIVVRSSFANTPGTVICRGEGMEVRKNVRGIAHDTDVAKITLAGVPDRPGIAYAIFAPLAEAGISVDTIVQTASIDGITDLSFTVSGSDLTRSFPLVQQVASRIGAATVDAADDLAKVSIVGTGMQSAPGYAARMFGALSEQGININMITTSDIRITCIIQRAQVQQAVQTLHAAFELDRE